MNLTDSVFVREFRDNWPILVTAFLCLLFAFSAPGFSMPALFQSVIEEFGWTREQATLLASAKYATGSVVAIVIGRILDSLGVRAVLIGVSTLGGLALISFLWVDGLPSYYAAGMLFGIAAPGTIVAIKVMISRTFHASQGTAMGVAMLGTALGATIVPPIITTLIDQYGWRQGMALMSTGIWVIALPLLIFFYRGRAAKQVDSANAVTSADTSTRAEKRQELYVLMRQPTFWLIFAAVFSAAFVDQAFIQHHFLFMGDLGFERSEAAIAASFIGAIGFAARPIIGGVFDRWSNRGVSAAYVLLVLASSVALLVTNPALLMIFVVLRAFGHSAVLLDTTVLAKHTFGVRNLGLVLGIYTAAVNLGFMSGPWVVARMFDASGSYSSAFILCVAVGIFAAAILIPVRPDYWLRMRSKFGRAETVQSAGKQEV